MYHKDSSVGFTFIHRSSLNRSRGPAYELMNPLIKICIGKWYVEYPSSEPVTLSHKIREFPGSMGVADLWAVTTGAEIGPCVLGCSPSGGA